MFRLLSAALAALPLLASATPVSLSKRTSGRATYYQTGMGACGQWNNPGDFIVAMNSAQYGSGYPSPNCGRGITISYNGKTAHAIVTDECPYGACNYGDIDMSEGLFTFFEPTSVGVFYVTWEWDGEGAPAPAPQPAYTPPAAVDPPYVPPAAVDPPYVPPAAVDPPSNNNNNNNVPPPADPTTTSTSSTPAPTDTTPVVNAAPNPDPAVPSSSSSARASSSSTRPASSSAANNGAGNVAVAPVDGDTNGAASVTASVTLALGAVSALFALL